MDIAQIIRELHLERERVDKAIRLLEELILENRRAADAPRGGGRGRKFMGQAERLAVSQRMRKYWEERRQKNRVS